MRVLICEPVWLGMCPFMSPKATLRQLHYLVFPLEPSGFFTLQERGTTIFVNFSLSNFKASANKQPINQHMTANNAKIKAIPIFK
jgi:hypothetical protein